MATFEAQVEALTSLSVDGSSAPTQTELTQFLTDGAKEILNAIPVERKRLFTTSNDLNSSSVNLTIAGSEIYGVTRDDGTINQPCREIPHQLSGRARDSGDMSAATATDPVYYISNNILSVIPEPSNSNNAHVHTMAYPAVAYGDSSITKFPDDAEYLVPIYASIKSLQNVLADKASGNTHISTALTAMNTELDELQSIADNVHTEIGLAKTEAAEIATQTDNSGDIATALTAINTELDKVDEVIVQASEEFDEVATQTSGSITSAISAARSAVPSVLSISDLNINAVLPVAPSAPSFDAGAISISASAPSYGKTSLTLGTTPTISDLNINAVLPMAPSINTISYTDATNADASATAVSTATASAPSIIDVSSNAPDYTKPSLTTQVAFANYNASLNEADPGVLSITAVSPSVPSLSSTAVSFSEIAPIYIQPSVSPDFKKVDTHLDTNEDIEMASVKINEIQAQIQEYNANIQNHQANFNKENIEYQAKLQIAIKDAEYDNQEDARALQKYQAEVGKYQADVSKEIQEYDKKLSQYSLELNTRLKAWMQTQADNLQKFQLDIQNELNEFNKDNARYQVELREAVDKNSADLQVAIANANNQAQELRQEASQTTDVDKFNKAQDQALSLANAVKQMEDLIADNNSKISKYSSELQSYQSQVNKDVQEYQQNLDGDLRVWQAERQTDIQKYSNDIQDELNEFNREQAVFSNELQEKVQEASNQQAKDSSEYSAKLQKYSNEMQSYSAQVNKAVQEYQQNLQQKIQEFDSARKLQQSYMEEAQAGISSGNSYIQEAQAIIAQAGGYAAEVNARAGFTGAKTQAVQAYISTAQSYIAEMQSKVTISQGYANEVQMRLGVDTAHYGWYESQQTKLQADYDKGLQILIGG
tara:strand:+ start:864 stop:3518 length:2655 start_codon:yes stop_codon:yes gene_type:complete